MLSTHLVEADDLSIGLLDLAELHQEVPETGLGNNGVRSEYSHAVELGSWVRLSWQVAANDLVFRKTCCDGNLLAIIHNSSPFRMQRLWRQGRKLSIFSMVEKHCLAEGSTLLPYD